MNDYVVPKEVIEWAKKEIQSNKEYGGEWVDGYVCALQNFLNKINVVYTKDTE